MGSKRRVLVDGRVKCSCCSVFKEPSEFFKSKGKGELEIESACKICSMERKRLRKKPKAKELSRDCVRCGEEKGIEEFAERGRLCSICIDTPLPKQVTSKEDYTRRNKKYSKKLEDRYKTDVEEQILKIFESDTDDEIWKYIPNFNNKYQASNLGRVRCLPIVYRTPKGSLIKTQHYIVKNSQHEGYSQTPLTDLEGRIYHKGTHRWVMYAFHGESELQVDHINGIRDDNQLSNLRYATARENSNYRKDTNPEYFTSSLYGTYKQKDKWCSYIDIQGTQYYLGLYNEEVESHNVYMKAWKDWEDFGRLPEKWENPDKSSQIDGIDFHNASNKWRVRLKDRGLYIGIFETEVLAERVLKIVNYLISRGLIINPELVKKIRKKYTTDKRFKYLVNIETGEEFHCLETASKSIGLKVNTLYNKLNKNSSNDTPIRYK